MFPVPEDLIMKVRTGRLSGVTHFPYYLANSNFHTCLHTDLIQLICCPLSGFQFSDLSTF